MKTSPLTRRQFLFGAAVLAAGCATSKSSAKVQPVVGSQTYGWGQYYERGGRKLSDQLDEMMKSLSDSGYDYAEGWLEWERPQKNAEFAEKLLKHGLKPVSLYTGGRFDDPLLADDSIRRILLAADVARQAGFVVINCNPDPIGRDKTAGELKIQARALVRLGEGLRAMGLRLGIHHHTPEMRNGAREFHSNFEHNRAGTVDFCYDVHWVYRGGIEPLDCLTQYGNRVVCWHLRQSRDKIWWEDLAAGDIDYTAVARYSIDHQLPPRYTVELALEEGTKITRTVAENHRLSREYVRQVFGV